MPTVSLLACSIAIAAVAHENQLDKAGAPYILHPIRMMMKAQTDDERIVAILHDVVEDTDWTFEGLAAEGFPDYILTAIDGVTKREGEAYEDFVDRSAHNPLSLRVKLLDLEDNMTTTRLGDITQDDFARLQRYHAAYSKLKKLVAQQSAGGCQ